MTKINDSLISKGTQYKNKESGEVVNVFFVDLARDLVRYSLESGATGQEFTENLERFRKEFDDVAPPKIAA